MTGKVVMIVALAVGIGLAVFAFVLWFIKSHAIYEQGLARLQSAPQAEAALGTPLSAGFWALGRIKNQAASIQIPVSGPKGVGSARVLGEKRGGQWVMTRLILTPDGAEAIEIPVSP